MRHLLPVLALTASCAAAVVDTGAVRYEALPGNEPVVIMRP